MARWGGAGEAGGLLGRADAGVTADGGAGRTKAGHVRNGCSAGGGGCRRASDEGTSAGPLARAVTGTAVGAAEAGGMHSGAAGLPAGTAEVKVAGAPSRAMRPALVTKLHEESSRSVRGSCMWEAMRVWQSAEDRESEQRGTF